MSTLALAASCEDRADAGRSRKNVEVAKKIVSARLNRLARRAVLRYTQAASGDNAMFADNTLTPKEAVRLCALGLLALSPRSYATLASDVRHFVGRVVGPTPEIMGHSIELLRYEGLVEAMGEGDAAKLHLTDAGRAAMRELLLANVRAHSTELNKLVMALKFKFLHLLPLSEQRLQVALLADATDRELARFADLRAHHAEQPGFLVSWLDHDIQALERRLEWLAQFQACLVQTHGSGDGADAINRS
ncbi:MAG: hypothetical protein MUE49_12690 [Rhodospirillales bacterium]|nr:hypothetical protein [Rhodospirillales bacterium]